MISERMKQRIEEMPDAQLIDWICLYCVDVRSTHSDDDAQDFINDIRQALEMRLNATPQPVSAPEWTNEQCLEFLSIAFRHANISGDIEMDDIRLGIRMVNAAAAAPGGQDD